MHRKVSPAPCVLTVQVGEGPEPKGEAASFSSSPAPSRHLQDLARAWGISPVVSAPPPGEVYPSHDLGRERSEKPWLQHEKAVNFFTNSHFTPRFVHSCSAFNLQKKKSLSARSVNSFSRPRDPRAVLLACPGVLFDLLQTLRVPRWYCENLGVFVLVDVCWLWII